MEKKLLLGLRLIRIFLILHGVLFIFWGLCVLTYVLYDMVTPADAAKRLSNVTGFVYAVAASFLGILCIIDASWISKLKKKGINLGLITTAFSLLLSGLFVIRYITQGMNPNGIQYYATVSLFFVITYGSCFYYLTRLKVKEQFK